MATETAAGRRRVLVSDNGLERLLRGLPLGTYGERLYACRVRANLTRAELAAASGVHVETIKAIEGGRRRSTREHTAKALAEALTHAGLPDVSMAWLQWRVGGYPEEDPEAAS